MKRYTLMAVVLLVVIAGCAAVQVQIDPTLVGKVLGRRIGFELALKAPVDAVELIPYAQEVIDAEDVRDAAELLAAKLLTVQVPGDPLLGEDLKDLASIFRYELEWSDTYVDATRAIAAEYIKGVVLAQTSEPQ